MRQQQKISGFYAHEKRVLQSTPDPTLTNVKLILPRLALIMKLSRTQTKPFSLSLPQLLFISFSFDDTPFTIVYFF
jgi:hypothetical protein